MEESFDRRRLADSGMDLKRESTHPRGGHRSGSRTAPSTRPPKGAAALDPTTGRHHDEQRPDDRRDDRPAHETCAHEGARQEGPGRPGDEGHRRSSSVPPPAAGGPVMMRAAVYARKSSDNEAGVERQVEIARDFIAKQEWLPGPVFNDNAISGATFDRPGLSALLAAVAAKPRPFDVLVMMNVDRLSRGTIAETLELQQRILKAGVEIWFYQTGQRVTLTTATDELKGAIDAYGARDFRDQIKMKTKAALRKKAEQGHATGARTFGYALVRKDGHGEREVVPEQAALVVRIFELAAEGQGDRRIANLLNSEHAPAPGPKGWSKDGIRRALDNQLYIGVACYGKREVPESEWIRAELPELRIVTD